MEMEHPLVQDVEILKVGPDSIVTERDVVVAEQALHLTINGEPLATLMCLPEAIKELVTGFLISEGLVRTPEEILSFRLSQEGDQALVQLSEKADLPLRLYGNRTVNIGCGSPSLFPRTLDSIRTGTVPSSAPVPCHVLVRAMRDFQGLSSLHGKTGGVHSAAILRGGEIYCFREDVGRHNAVDKVAGRVALDGVNPLECALLSSGRISSDLATKAAVHGIPVVASRSAPTARALEICRLLGIGLAGFVRGTGMNIYSGEQRFDLSAAAHVER